MAVTANQVQSLYLAYFGRPAEQAGLNYWTAQTSATVDQISAAFAQQQEYTSVYGNLNRAQTIQELYNNLFNRSASDAEVSYWNTSSTTTVDKLALALVNGANGNDAVTLSNKIDIASAITTQAGTAATGVQVAAIGNAAPYDLDRAFTGNATTGTSAAQEAAAYFATVRGEAVSGPAYTINGANVQSGGQNVSGNLNIQAGAATVAAAAATGAVAFNLADASTVSLLNLNGTVGTETGTTAAASAVTIGEVGTTDQLATLNISLSNAGVAPTSTTIAFNTTDAPSALTTVNGSASSAALTIDASALTNLTSLQGGSGNDVLTVTGRATALTVDGNAGNDTIVATATGTGALTLNGGAGNDTITGTSGAALLTINGGEGNDTINITTTGATAATTVNAGAGNDVVRLAAGDFGAGNAHAVNIDLGAGSDTLVVTALSNARVAITTGADAAAIAQANSTQLAQDLIKVANFNAGDLINVSAAGGPLTVSTADLSGATSLYSAFSTVLGNGATAANLAFQYGGNTYIAHSDTTAGVTDGDGLIELTGFQGTFVATAATGTFTAA